MSGTIIKRAPANGCLNIRIFLIYIGKCNQLGLPKEHQEQPGNNENLKTSQGAHVMKFYQIAAVLLIGIVTQGCATNIGNAKTEDFGSYLQLEKGKSTKEDVHRIFGQPQDVKYLEGNNGSIWEYIYARSTMSGATFVPFVGLLAGGNNVDSKISTFYFNELGIFFNVETVSKSKYVNQWVGITKGVSDAINDEAPDRVRNEMSKLNLPFDEKAAKRLKGIETWTE